MTWKTIHAPPGLSPPDPLTVRVQSIPARHYFPEHWHTWNQVVYAISGVLTVTASGRSFVISPEQAVWLPQGTRHRVGSLLGAEFRSLWIGDGHKRSLPTVPTPFEVSSLLRALIVEIAQVSPKPSPIGYVDRLTELIFDQLLLAKPLISALPWATDRSVTLLCEALYENPSDVRSVSMWAERLHMSERTLARRFAADTGMSLRSWRRRLRLFKAVELLSSGFSVTEAAMELGYSSASAFVYAFRTEMGVSPSSYCKSSGTALP
jgi:AraC-like DNA-binding protein